MTRPVAFLGLLAGLAACAQPAPMTPPVAVVTPPAPPPGMMTTPVVPVAAPSSCVNTNSVASTMRLKEGTSCIKPLSYVINGRTTSNSRLPFTSGEVTKMPAHGTTSLAFSDSGSTVTYQPAAGYVGRDYFEMRLLPSSRLWTVNVTVTP